MFTPISICVRLTAAIQDAIGSNFLGIKPWAIVEKHTDTEAEIMYMLSNNTKWAFAELRINCSTDMHEPNFRHVNISAKMRQIEGPNKNFDDFLIEELMDKYKKLRINVVTGTLNYPRTNSKVAKTRTLEIRFTIHHERVNIDDLSGRTYEYETEIARKALPYVRALEDINEQLSFQLINM
jgi:hypothetical protein